MENRDVKRSQEQQKQAEPGDMSSFNNRNETRSTETEGAEKGKDESESYMDYNGNSEQNAPAKSE